MLCFVLLMLSGESGNADTIASHCIFVIYDAVTPSELQYECYERFQPQIFRNMLHFVQLSCCDTKLNSSANIVDERCHVRRTITCICLGNKSYYQVGFTPVLLHFRLDDHKKVYKHFIEHITWYTWSEMDRSYINEMRFHRTCYILSKIVYIW